MILITILVTIAAFLLALTVHEFSHALAADKLGDPTAKLMDRLTLNPIKHIDPIGTVALPALLIISGSPFVFGWAKPVPFDPFNLENPRRDGALIAVAGPISNMLLACLFAIVFRILGPTDVSIAYVLPFITINVVLSLFNLIPVSPLDGFKVVLGVLPESMARGWQSLENYGMYILLFLLIFPLGQQDYISRVLGPSVIYVMSLLVGLGA